jgi:hypothetical protein
MKDARYGSTRYLVSVFATVLLCLSLATRSNPSSGGDDDVAYTVSYNGNGATSGTTPADSAAYSSGNLYAGGEFNIAGGVSAKYVAKLQK